MLMKIAVPTYVRRLLWSVLALSPALLWGQPLEVTDGVTNPYTPENLITNVFLGDGVEVLNVTFEGDPISVGFFKNGEDEVGIDRGLMMTSGRVSSGGGAVGVDNPGSSFASTNNASTATDPDMVTIGSPFQPFNVCKYTITFVPTADTLRFRYVFASEEYPEWACSSFNDIFGFFISGPGISGPYAGGAENIAIIPGTNLPVTINNLHPMNGGNCPPSFEQFYNDNNGSPNMPVYDGFTDVFTAEAVVTPCETYTIKLVISDVGDGIFDSGVFLEAKSFGTGSLEVDIATLSLDGTITEECSDAVLTFSLPGPAESDFPIDYTIFGTATNGVDYSTIPTDLFIPAGDSTISVSIQAFEDGIVEGTEFIALDVQRDVCNRDTFFIYIRENELIPPELGPDLTICSSDTVQLDGTVNIPLPPPPTFTNTNDYLIDPPFETVLSPINVVGVQPFELGPGVIRSVCFNIEHKWLSDLDIFLQAPNGQFVELTTDNGSNGDNYTQTCFEPDAALPITYISPPASGAPYTGTFAAEGVWEDLWSAQDNPTNGTWNLLLIDDANGFAGTLLDWTIVFEPLYQIYYEWTPSAGLSCDDCPDPLASPDTTTTYVLRAYDSYGCEVFDTLTIEVKNALPAPVVNCSVNSDTCITFTWNDIPGSLGYEVNVDGGGWEPANGSLSHTVCGLNYNQTVSILVHGIDECDGFDGSASCTTPDCMSASPTLDLLQDVSCFGADDGTIQVSATGPNPPFTFTLGGITNDTGLFTDLGEGTYDIVVTTSAGCNSTLQATVSEPAPINLSQVVLNDITCNGDDDGSATVSISGGTYPYAFTWTNGQVDSIATNLPEGDVDVLVTDANGCSNSLTVTIEEPATLQLTPLSTVVTCNGGADGTATIIPNGGSGAYIYQWDASANSQNTPTADSLAAGMYTVVVTDANGCTATETIEVTENSPITLMTSTTDASCNGFEDGSATVSASGGGIGFYLYQWDAAADNQITATAANLSVGAYTVTVTDLLNCEAVTTVDVLAPNAMMVDIATEPTSCSNLQDGAASVSVSGGTLGYTYAWSDGGAAIPDRDDLSAGVQTVTVTDANGCFEVVPFEILAASAIDLQLSATDANCFDAADGTATVIASGGTGNFTYLWSNNQMTATATGLSAGTASVTVTDDNGCQEIANIPIGEPAELVVDLSSVAADCFGENSGSATALPSGGTGNYTYQWSNLQNTSTATALVAGNYAVTVTDANGCTVNGSIAVGQPPLLTTTTDFTPLSCDGGPDGTATVVPAGGTPPYNYLWSDNQVTPTATGLAAQQYNVTVTDANGCLEVDQVTLTSPDQVSLTLSTSDVSCFAGDDGLATVTILTGTAPYDIEWSNGQSTPTANSLTAGNYSVTVTDASGCTADATAQIFEPGELSADLTQDAALCHDGNDGTAAVTSVYYGGVSAPLGDFTFAWSTIPAQNGAGAANLQGGQAYTVTITDAAGCELVETIAVDNPKEVVASIESATDVSCAEGSDGTATAIASGGVEPYSYSWGANTGSQNTPTASGLAEGTYFVTVADANGCQAVVSTTIDQPEPLGVGFVSEKVDCFGASTGSLSAQAEGGTAPYTYVWSTGQQGKVIDALAAGTYTVTIFDANGCELIETSEVFQPEAPLAALFEADDVSCFGREDGVIYLEPSGGTPPYTFSVDGEHFVGTTQLVGLEAGEYNVWMRDSRGCEYITSEILILEPEPLSVDLGPDLRIDMGETAVLDAEVSAPVVSYEWIPLGPEGLNCYDCFDPETDALFNPATYELVVTDENGCTAEDRINVFVHKDRLVLVPPAFSPNSDSHNDRLLVHGKSGTTVTLFQVYDRWGELVFEAGDFPVNDPNIGWDGSFKGELMNSGVFIWYVEVRYVDGVEETFKGSTTLIR